MLCTIYARIRNDWSCKSEARLSAASTAHVTVVLLAAMLLATAQAVSNNPAHFSITSTSREVAALPVPHAADLTQADFIHQFRRFTDALYPTREEQEHARAAINDVAQLIEQRMSSYKVDRVHKGGAHACLPACLPDTSLMTA
jgi:hypothetical protein